jgi:glutathione S-transferase
VNVRLYDHEASANCYKARLLFALLAREYERVPVDIFAGDTLSADYAALNRARETPALELDNGTVLTQSNAILCSWQKERTSFHWTPSTELRSSSG